MRIKIQKNLIKMIKIITLIPASVAYLMIAGCNCDDGSAGGGVDTSISGEVDGSADPLMDLQEQGKLPDIGTGPKIEPQPTTTNGGLSLYSPEVDPDQDNVPNSAIAGRPEIPIDDCPQVYNPGQEDDDGDGIGNACEN